MEYEYLMMFLNQPAIRAKVLGRPKLDIQDLMPLLQRLCVSQKKVVKPSFHEQTEKAVCKQAQMVCELQDRLLNDYKRVYEKSLLFKDYKDKRNHNNFQLQKQIQTFQRQVKQSSEQLSSFQSELDEFENMMTSSRIINSLKMERQFLCNQIQASKKRQAQIINQHR